MMVPIAARVAKFHGFVKEEMKGMAPIRQSHVRREGWMSSHELMKVRWRSWSWRAGEGSTRRVLASLHQSEITKQELSLHCFHAHWDTTTV